LSLLAWIVLGFLTAFVASKTINKTSEGRALDIMIGIAGAIFGGYAFQALSAPGPAAFSFWGPFCRSSRRRDFFGHVPGHLSGKVKRRIPS